MLLHQSLLKDPQVQLQVMHNCVCVQFVSTLICWSLNSRLGLTMYYFVLCNYANGLCDSRSDLPLPISISKRHAGTKQMRVLFGNCLLMVNSTQINMFMVTIIKSYFRQLWWALSVLLSKKWNLEWKSFLKRYIKFVAEMTWIMYAM